MILVVVSPVFHEYADPPLAVNVVELPEQINSGDAVTLTESALRIKFKVTTLSHPPPGLSLYQ